MAWVGTAIQQEPDQLSHILAVAAVISHSVQWRSAGFTWPPPFRVHVDPNSSCNEWRQKACFLLESGADADIMAGKFGFALQAACGAKYEPDPRHYTDNYNYDIDHVSVKTKLLLELLPDINVNAQGGIFNTALQAAAYSGQTASIRLLLDKQADCNIRGGKYGSALNAAIISGWWDIVEILLKAGATPDCQLQETPDEEWLRRIREEDGRGAYERYMKFWEVQSASASTSKRP